MKKVLLIGLLIAGCNTHNGKEIDEGIYICTKTTETQSGCLYHFKTKRSVINLNADCGKYNIGDTL